MSSQTNIQWCDSTVNPIMGCGGCELYPGPGSILEALDQLLIVQLPGDWSKGRTREVIAGLIDGAISVIGTPAIGHIDKVTTTNIYHLRKQFGAWIAGRFNKATSEVAVGAIEAHIKCYAAKLHLNKGYSIVNPYRKPNPGYAPTFEQVTLYEGRINQAAEWSDLYGQARPDKPWLDGLPRLIFVSDMGDALTDSGHFDFLQREFKATQTTRGRRHIWLWLTKRPELMQRFAVRLGGLPKNFCAMTTVTSRDAVHRIDALRETDAPARGLSIEPLWTPIADVLDLTGIDWVIIGGESGAEANTSPFHLEWVEEVEKLCRQHGVALFCKQLGRRPMRGEVEIDLHDKHGGDWDEWEKAYRLRDIPSYFRSYR